MHHKRKAYFLAIATFSFALTTISSQDQKVADSLIVVYDSGIYQDSEMDILLNITVNEMNPDRRLVFSENLIEKSSKSSAYKYLHKGYLEKGNALREKGNYALALQSYFKSINGARSIGDSLEVGKLNISIADTYSEMGNSKNAETYYTKGIQILRKAEADVFLANALLNAGDEALNKKKLNTALEFFEESGALYRKKNYLVGIAYNKGNIGMVYAEQGKDILAESHINEAIKLLEELEDYYPISVYLIAMSDIYLQKKQHRTAIDYAHKSLSLAQQYQLKDQISEANLKLSQLYQIIGNQVVSYKHYKSYIIYRDSLINVEKVQQIAEMRTDYEVSQKQVELDLMGAQNDLLITQKRNQLIILCFAGVLLIVALWFYRVISKEKKKSEKLLLNILPEDTAKELMLYGKVKAKQYDSVSVLFTDFKGFTNYSENLSPEALVETVDFYFSKFDTIIDKYGLEKIKTIGDAYMCVGGLNHNKENHANNTIAAAFEIAEFVKNTKNDTTAIELSFDIRIGINSGPVVAGVVGTKKFAYDIWGDTVNVASRMESMSEPGKINISNSTFELIKTDFDCDYRGEIEAKNRGKIKMYFVKAAKSDLLSIANEL
jgi:class 3 adenylate cyclase